MSLWVDRAATYVKAYMRTRLGWDSWTRTETDQWGNADTTTSTQAWALLFGPATQLSADGTQAITSLNVVGATRGASLPVGEYTDIETVVDVLVPVTPATAGIRTLHVVRMQDSSNYYYARMEVTTSSTVQVALRKNVAGSDSQIAAAVTVSGLTHSTTVPLTVRCGVAGEVVRAKVWLSSDDPPDDDDWDVTCTDPSLQVGTSIGFGALLVTGNTNTLPVPVYWDDFTAFSPARWTDITDWVLIGNRGQPITGYTGRSTELSDIDPSNLSFTLENQNGWFTPDNTASPYWPDWQTGTPIRWSETIGPRSFAFPDMWLELPETALSFEGAGQPTLTDRVMRVSCVDQLTRLNRAPAFVSNLAAYIVGEATEGALRAYWPLVDASGSTYGSAAGPVNQDPLRYTQVQSYTPVRFDENLINFGGQAGPPGDDSTAVEWTTDGTDWARLANSAINDSTPATDGVATLAMWVYVPAGIAALDQIALLRDLDTSAIYILIDGFASAGGTSWRTDFNTFGGVDDSITGPTVVGGTWHFVAVQLDFGTGLGELWLDDEPVLTGDTGTPGTGGLPLDRLVLDGSEDSASGVRTAHVQVYIGDLDSFTHEDFLAQYQVGMFGFPQVTVDQRIRTICTYAGIDDSRLDIEESDSPIQAPAFAGQRPGDLATAAAVTGGGILFTQGDRLVYHDRKHRFGL